MARPTSFKTEYIEQAQRLCTAIPVTECELADFFEVSEKTLYRWQIHFPEFRQALKFGKQAQDDRVVASLFKRAVGFHYDAEKPGRNGPVKYREYVPPDTTACIFWLKNRQRQQWRDVYKHELGQAGEFDQMDAAAIRALIQAEAQALGIGPDQLKTIEHTPVSKHRPEPVRDTNATQADQPIDKPNDLA